MYRRGLSRAQQVFAAAAFIHQHVGQSLERLDSAAAARQQFHRQVDGRSTTCTGDAIAIEAVELLVL
jgi:hypothetical protein